MQKKIPQMQWRVGRKDDSRKKANDWSSLWIDTTMEGGFSPTYERSRSMSLDFLNAAMGCLFVGVWIIVGHIIAVDYF